jgi:peptide/nickel transport system permease protein
MLAYILQRIAQSIFVLLAVAVIAFALFNYVGDPIHNMVGQETSMEERERLRQDLGLNDPFYVQFTRFVTNAAQGDFGVSYRHGRQVSELIAERLPATLELSLVAAILALLIGIPMGVYTGIKPNSILSRVFMTTSLIGVSFPTFLIGILLIWLFSVELQWLPSFGRNGVVQLGHYWSTSFLTWDGWRSLILPSITLCLFQMTFITRLVRSEMLEVLRTDYIKFGRARGLTNRAIYFGHALKNTMVPVITIAGLQIGMIIAFAIITETVFQWPGMGLLFIQAINFVDIPIMAAYLMLVAVIFVSINLIVDMLYFTVDPRLRVQRKVHTK